MIEIRACTPDDAAAVSTLLGELGYTVPVRQATENIQELSKTGADLIFVAVADARVVGLLAAHVCRMLQYATPVVRVTALAVERRARRRGVGRLLMEHAEQICSTTECEFVELTSAMNRTDAHAFYRSIGYEPNSLRFRREAEASVDFSLRSETVA